VLSSLLAFRYRIPILYLITQYEFQHPRGQHQWHPRRLGGLLWLSTLRAVWTYATSLALSAAMGSIFLKDFLDNHDDLDISHVHPPVRHGQPPQSVSPRYRHLPCLQYNYTRSPLCAYVYHACKTFEGRWTSRQARSLSLDGASLDRSSQLHRKHEISASVAALS
jgi:hypothetical protein